MKSVTYYRIGFWLPLFVFAFLSASAQTAKEADLVIYNARIYTQDLSKPTVSAVAIKDGKFIATGSDIDVLKYAIKATKKIDAGGRIVIPGLNDNHIHIIRGGRFYNLELRWDGVPTLKRAMEMLKEQAARTPDGQWVRVVGGWNEYQFEEKRLPTLDEINKAVPDKPVFISYLYSKAFINKTGLRALNIVDTTSNPVGGLIEKDIDGQPTGLLVAEPSAMILYSTIAKLPILGREETINSTKQFLTELNRFGVTSASDPGGGGHVYPTDYNVIETLAKAGQLTVRIPFYLSAQTAGKELAEYKKWMAMLDPGHPDESLRENGLLHEGGGEGLVASAGDFENFLYPRPELVPQMESQLKEVVKAIMSHRWDFRIHATYNESITRFLAVFEEVNKTVPFKNIRWYIDHAETISDDNLKRIKALGGGIALQNRMAYQGELFIRRYGKQKAATTPSLRKILDLKIPTGLGTDATRVGTYNPWISIYWAVTGKTMGGTQLYAGSNRLSRAEALQLYTVGSAWFSKEEKIKGRIQVGQYADMVILTADFFSVPDEEIRNIEAALTITDGKVVYAKEAFSAFAPAPLPVLPVWSPVKFYGGYYHK